MADKPDESNAQAPGHGAAKSAKSAVRETTNVGPPPRATPPPTPAARESTQIRPLNTVLPPKRETARAAAVPPPAAVPTPVEDGNTDVGAAPLDPAARRARLDDLTRPHLAQLLEVMLEVRFGQASPKHVAPARHAAIALVRLVDGLDLATIQTSVGRFASAVERVLDGTKGGVGERYDELVRAYESLIESGIGAAELEPARARREPVIVDALLRQIDGMESPAIAKLVMVGLDRLDAIAIATPDDIARMAGVRRELAAVIIHRFAEYRSERTVLSSPDGAVEYARLVDELSNLRSVCATFDAAAAQWSAEARQKKRVLRRARHLAYQRVRLALARLGEIELVARLDKQSFADRLDSANHLA